MPAFDSFLVGFRRPATTASAGDVRQKEVNTRASAVHRCCFEFHALNWFAGKHDLVQIAIGIAQLQCDACRCDSRCRTRSASRASRGP